MRILFIRGAFLNKFEGQNYEPLVKNHQIVGVGSLTSIHKKFAFPAKLFFSPYNFGTEIGAINQIGPIGERLVRGLFNRVLGDTHFLLGLEKFVKDKGGRGNKGYEGWDIGHIAETYYGYDLQVVKLKEGGFIKKIVSTCWETIAFNNETIAKKKRIKEIVKKNIDLFICPTEKAKLSLTVEGITDDKIRIIRVGVDLDRFKNKISNIKYQKNKSNIKNKKRDSFNMLFVGRLIEEKGVMEVYEIFKNVKCQMSSCDKLRMTLSKVEVSNVKTRLKLRIVGDGYLKEKLLNMIKKDKLGDNVFIEKKSYEEMPRVYQEADVLVVPSKTTPTWEEQYGMVLVEAMASGLPIVAYPSGAIPEVLGKAGLLVKEGDVKGLTQAIITLMNNTDLRIKLGKIGRRRAEKEFDREKIAKKIENIYKRLVLPT